MGTFLGSMIGVRRPVGQSVAKAHSQKRVRASFVLAKTYLCSTRRAEVEICDETGGKVMHGKRSERVWSRMGNVNNNKMPFAPRARLG